MAPAAYTQSVCGEATRSTGPWLDVGNFSWGSECEGEVLQAWVGTQHLILVFKHFSKCFFSRKSMAWTKILKFSC